jgi:hypothetical protein
MTWRRNRDAVAGQDAIKAGREIYLPKPNASDTSAANEDRYQRYLERALWYAAPERTLNSLLGSVFRKGPQVQEVPPQIEYMLQNADGGGSSLIQVAKEIVGELLAVGRIGLLVDYPRADQGATLEATAGLQAFVSLYPAESVINWRYETINGKKQLTMAVLTEVVETSVTEFLHDPELRFRVLRLRDGVYTHQIYNDVSGAITPEIAPRKADGATWDVIPFVIAGSTNNRPDVDRAPLTHLSNHAVAYWQTSADHRENLYTHGQLTLGITSDMAHDEWTKANPNGVVIGAPAGIFLGASGGFHTASAPESSSLSKALEDLRLEMAELGAQIIQRGSQAQTAEAARIDASAESSVLSNLVGNASEALEQALEWGCGFMGGDPEAVEYALSQEFFDDTIDAQSRLALMAEWQSGIIAKSDFRRALRKIDVLDAERSDDDIDAEVATTAPSVTGEAMDLGT